MADNPTSPAGGSHESGGEQSPHSGVREQDRYLPIANISRIMKKALPANGKIAKDAKDTVQECVSEFISFITSEASDKCQKEKRKTINGDDLLWAMATLGFEDYIEPLKVYLARYREMEGDTKGSARGGDGSAKRDAIGGLPGQNPQFALQGSMNYISSQLCRKPEEEIWMVNIVVNDNNSKYPRSCASKLHSINAVVIGESYYKGNFGQVTDNRLVLDDNRLILDGAQGQHMIVPSMQGNE